MKVQNANNSSFKTRKLIKDTFSEMLSEKKEINKITVSELAKRANISRATFYSHFDDIYAVAEEFKAELFDALFSNEELGAADDFEQFFEVIFSFMKKHSETYKILCRSDATLLYASRFIVLVCNKFLELACDDKRIKNRDNIELEIRVFFEGCLFEYVKYCRAQSAFTLDDLHAYAKQWCRSLIKNRERA